MNQSVRYEDSKVQSIREVQIHTLNLGIHKKPQLLKLNVNLDYSIANVTEQLLTEYKDIFAWTYKVLRGIPPHLVHN
jgi:hypothetical protein